jgi:hypothetical protein
MNISYLRRSTRIIWNYGIQRAMGDGELQIISKFKFEGRNIEEFVGKFRHVAEQFKVSKIFFDNYGRAAPMGMIKLLRNG